MRMAQLKMLRWAIKGREELLIRIRRIRRVHRVKLKDNSINLTNSSNSGTLRRLDNGGFGIFVEKMHLAHIKDKVHILIEWRAVVRADTGNKIMPACVKVKIDL